MERKDHDNRGRHRDDRAAPGDVRRRVPRRTRRAYRRHHHGWSKPGTVPDARHHPAGHHPQRMGVDPVCAREARRRLPDPPGRGRVEEHVRLLQLFDPSPVGQHRRRRHRRVPQGGRPPRHGPHPHCRGCPACSFLAELHARRLTSDPHNPAPDFEEVLPYRKRPLVRGVSFLGVIRAFKGNEGRPYCFSSSLIRATASFTRWLKSLRATKIPFGVFTTTMLSRPITTTGFSSSLWT